MVKTRWRWVHCINLKDIAADLSLEYQRRRRGKTMFLEWQLKGTNLRLHRNGDSHT